MKKVVSLILAFLTVLSLSGCGTKTSQGEDTVSFYYLREADSYIYGAPDGVVTGEVRAESSASSGTGYLLSLYLMGPLDENLRSPFPAGCEITNIVRNGKEVTVVLNANFTTLKGIHLSLACVCLARTCMSVTGAEVVQIHAETFDGKILPVETVSVNSLLLEEPSNPTENPS
jgi:hypothetical protein